MTDKEPDKRYSTIMLVDDNEIDNLINLKMLEASNIAHRIYIYTSSLGALEYLKNLDREKNTIKEMIPEVILLDINMPIMDGFQFVEEYKRISTKIKNTCKIVMLTSSLNPSDEERSKKDQFIEDYLKKPLSEEQLDKL